MPLIPNSQAPGTSTKFPVTWESSITPWLPALSSQVLRHIWIQFSADTPVVSLSWISVRSRASTMSPPRMSTVPPCQVSLSITITPIEHYRLLAERNVLAILPAHFFFIISQNSLTEFQECCEFLLGTD